MLTQAEAAPLPDAVEFARLRLGFEPDRAAGGGAAVGGEAGDSELHAAVGQVDGGGGEGGAPGVYASRGVWCWWRVRRTGRRRSLCGRRRRWCARLGIKPRGDGDNEISLLFPNGSRIVGLPGAEGTVRGFSAVSLLLIDEASRVEDAMYKALRPMLAVGDGRSVADEHAVREAGVLLSSVGARRAGVATGDGAGDGVSADSARSFWRRSGRSMGARGSGRSICASSWTDGTAVFGRDLVERRWTSRCSAHDRMPLIDGRERGGHVLCGAGSGAEAGSYGDGGGGEGGAVAAVIRRRSSTGCWCGMWSGCRWGRRIRGWWSGCGRCCEMPELRGECALVVDATGVGAPVVEMLRAARLGCEIAAVTITGGEKAKRRAGAGWNVPKQDLIAGVQVLLERGELRIARRIWRMRGALVRGTGGYAGDDEREGGRVRYGRGGLRGA